MNTSPRIGPNPALFFAMFLCFLVRDLAAQQQDAKPATPNAASKPESVVVKGEKPVSLGQTFTLAPGEHDLPELVAKAATILGRNILWSDTERAQKGSSLSVSLNNPVKLTPQSFEELVGGLLYTQGFAIVPIDAEKGFYEVISLVGPRGRELMSRAPWRKPDEVLARPTHREFVLTTIRLKHTNAMVCSNSLRPFFATNSHQVGQLTIGSAGNEAMLIAGFTDQVCAAIRLIQECDQPPSQPPDPMMMGPDAQNQFAAMQAKVKSLQEQVAELQRAVGVGKK